MFKHTYVYIYYIYTCIHMGQKGDMPAHESRETRLHIMLEYLHDEKHAETCGRGWRRQCGRYSRGLGI